MFSNEVMAEIARIKKIRDERCELEDYMNESDLSLETSEYLYGRLYRLDVQFDEEVARVSDEYGISEMEICNLAW